MKAYVFLGMDVSFTKLQQLIRVAKAGSISKAASELNLSQPALSRTISAIEDRYGFKIFNRLGHGVQLTAAGAQVIADAEPLVHSMRAFHHNLRLFKDGKAGRLRLGMSSLLASEVLVHVAQEFFDSGSRAQLRVMVRPGNELFDALKNDAIELFFFPEGQLYSSAEVEIGSVGEIDPICVVRSGHPLAGRSGLRLADLADYPWASSIEAPSSIHMTSEARFVCDNYHILRDMVLRTDLVTICSHGFVGEELKNGVLKVITVEDLGLSATRIVFAHLPGRMMSPLAQHAVERVRSHLQRGLGN